jgi:MoaA/NifB/PqqE/SkfB family radical SAM enzyme
MCNAELEYESKPMTITFEKFKLYERILRPYHIPVCTISGGEPTMVPDMPEILDYAVKTYPFGVSILTNLYGSESRIRKVMESALRNNVTVCVSFDGFGEVADKLRGGKNVSNRVQTNVEMISDMRKELGSSSIFTLHTVISDLNLHQLPEIADFSKKNGWTQSIAPVNYFNYLPIDSEFPRLSYSPELISACKLLLKQPHLTQLHSFIREIPNYVRNRSPKLCPYLSRALKTFKLFLEPNGDISLCDRVPIGNVRKIALHDMFQGQKYEERIDFFENCQGCWLACFVEPFLAIRPENLIRFDFLHRVPKKPNTG